MVGPTIAFIDCSAGIAGDMLLGALIDAGAPLDEIKRGLESLHGIKGEWKLSTSRVWKGPGSIAGIKANVDSIYQHEEAGAPTPGDAVQHDQEHEHHHNHGHGHSHTHQQDISGTIAKEEEVETALVDHCHEHKQEECERKHQHDHAEPMRNLDDIKTLIAHSELSDWVKEKSVRVFTLLAQAEAHTHGTSLEKIHFHEVGAIDSIVDTIGSVVALELLGVREAHASFLPFSSGTVKCMHGVLPVPPPATLRLMVGVPVCPAPKGAKGELVTPTGMSLVKALASTFGEPPPFIPTHTGVGAGTKDFPNHANIVRVTIGTKIDSMATETSYTNPAMRSIDNSSSFTMEQIVLFETNVDDLNPQSQPSHVTISILSRPEHEQEILETLFRETTTLGIRRKVMDRVSLSRKFVQVLAFGGSVDVKVAYLGNEAVNVHPEFEHCKVIAVKQKLPLLQVIDAVKALALDKINGFV